MAGKKSLGGCNNFPSKIRVNPNPGPMVLENDCKKVAIELSEPILKGEFGIGILCVKILFASSMVYSNQVNKPIVCLMINEKGAPKLTG